MSWRLMEPFHLDKELKKLWPFAPICILSICLFWVFASSAPNFYIPGKGFYTTFVGSDFAKL
jgi:hypothetical protein